MAIGNNNNNNNIKNNIFISKIATDYPLNDPFDPLVC